LGKRFLYTTLLHFIFFSTDILFEGQEEARKNGDVLYHSNSVIIKLKDFPSVRTDGSANILFNETIKKKHN